MIKVSVIVPVYNVEKYLRKCLDSLISQTLKDIEIICVDDGSTDSSLKILELYAAKSYQIKILRNNHEGVSAARNLGIKEAVGEYLGFVDSDDYVDKNFFERMYNAAKNNNCDIACAGFRRFKHFNGSIKKSFKKETVLSDINFKLEADNLPNDNYIWNKIYKRDSWNKYNIEFPCGRYFEDMAIVLKILYLLGNMVTVPDTFYYYRKRNGSIIKTKTKKIKDDFKWAKSELYNFASENNIALETRKDARKKITIKLFNLPLVKIYYYDKLIKYRLFGFISFMSKVTE